jgi:hypothetical protein
MKNLVVLSAVFFSGLAFAQSLPVFGTAKFGQAVFGGASAGTTSVGTDALPVPFMPLWATITLAVALWVVVLLMRSKEMAMLAFVRILTLIALAAAGPTFAAPITYIVEGTLVYDQNQSMEPDTPGLDGASLELAIIFDPDDPSPITATQANNFYVTEYRPATSASLTLTATAGGSNDGVYVVDPAALVIRNLHTDATNDFIEISMEDFDLNGKDFGDSILQVFFPNQSTPLTTPAPLFEYDASDVDYVTAEFEWGSGEFGFPGEGAAYYDLTNAVSYTAEPDADGDGVPDASDAFPNDASETTDTDGDGVGDNADVFPSDASETTDTDGDGVGDNADAYPNDASRNALAVPALPLLGLFMLVGLLGLFGLRKLRQ